MKTLKEWDKIGGTFDDYVKIGDIINRALYDYFLGVVTPALYGNKGFLMGEPMYHDLETGEAIFMAFGKGKEYYSYLGLMTMTDFKEYEEGKL